MAFIIVFMESIDSIKQSVLTGIDGVLEQKGEA
jgi:hypothetical protein